MAGYVNMDKLKGFLEKHKGLFYPALVLVIGLFFLLLPGESEPETVVTETGDEVFSLSSFTREAQELLSGIDGVGKLKLQLSLENDGSSTYLYDIQEASDDASESIHRETVLVEQDGNEKPITLERVYPTFRGAVVVCQGADSARVTLAVKEALSSLTGLGMDKITVLKMD